MIVELTENKGGDVNDGNSIQLEERRVQAKASNGVEIDTDNNTRSAGLMTVGEESFSKEGGSQGNNVIMKKDFEVSKGIDNP